MPEVGIQASINFNSLTVKAGKGESTFVSLAVFTPSWFPMPASLVTIGVHASFAPKIQIDSSAYSNSFLTFTPEWFPIPASLVTIGSHATFAPKIQIGSRSDLSLFLTFTRSSLQILFGDTYQQNSTELLIILDSLSISDKSRHQYLLAGILFNALEAFVDSLGIKVIFWDTKVIQESGLSVRYAAIIVEVYEKDT